VIVDITEASGAFVVRILRDGQPLATWQADAVDLRVGERVEQAIAATKLGVVFCGGTHVTRDQVRAAARGLPRGREFVACQPDRSNCRDTCP